jgi:hypothetical protein
VLWPDLTSAYYAKDTLTRIEQLKIEYVPKDENTLNLPQLRPIKILLGLLEKESLQYQLSYKRCKILDGKYQKRVEVH